MVKSTYIPPIIAPVPKRRRRGLFAAIANALLGVASAAQGATIIVDDASDISTVNCTLRDAISSANSESAIAGCLSGNGLDTIVFDPSILDNTITLSSEILISTPMTLKGPGADRITISGNNASSVFRIDEGSSAVIDVLISGLTLTEGSGTLGGALANAENLTLRDSTVSSSSASSGGGIYNGRNLRMERTTLSNNQAQRGGALFNFGPVLEVHQSSMTGNSAAGMGGGVLNYGYGEIVNSTLSGNTAGTSGGGLANYFYTDLTVHQSTLVSNSANSGGGLYNIGLDSEYRGTLRFSNTIVAGNAGGDCFNQPAGRILTNTNNLIEDGSCSGGAVNLIMGDPGLTELQNTSMDTAAHSPASHSIVIDALDAAECAAMPVDQSDMPRPVDGNGDDLASCDIGAVEFVDVFGPAAALPPVSDVMTSGGTEVSVSVTYTDDAPIDFPTIDAQDLVVAGPNFTLQVGSAALDMNSATATYIFTPPGGAWNDLHNGIYVISMVEDQVFDLATTGVNASPAIALESFVVDIPLNTAPVVDDANFIVRSNATQGTTVGQIVARDNDNNIAVASGYRIIAGNDAGAFGIDDSGMISVAALSLTAGTTALLTIEVADDRGLSDTGEVDITVTEQIFDNGFE